MRKHIVPPWWKKVLYSEMSSRLQVRESSFAWSLWGCVSNFYTFGRWRITESLRARCLHRRIRRKTDPFHSDISTLSWPSPDIPRCSQDLFGQLVCPSLNEMNLVRKSFFARHVLLTQTSEHLDVMWQDAPILVSMQRGFSPYH